ncbi:hypothetical protein COL05_25080 [Bacillus sp. AFS059628]|uniref:Uncharacterized protein n=1 Tax=Bacillus anthracis TaxID=1392 RepID=A0A2B0Y5F0_BACAN|nr:hypothetical protein COJ30_11325 [Bacillus anthracis]PFV74032.1 hypothetical protein COL05_25080 [Bacillus sp. AFS059628]
MPVGLVTPVEPVCPVGSVNGGIVGNLGPIKIGSSAALCKIPGEFSSSFFDICSPPNSSYRI